MQLITRKSVDQIYSVITPSLCLSYDGVAVSAGFSRSTWPPGEFLRDTSGFTARHALLSSSRADVTQRLPEHSHVIEVLRYSNLWDFSFSFFFHFWRLTFKLTAVTASFILSFRHSIRTPSAEVLFISDARLTDTCTLVLWHIQF